MTWTVLTVMVPQEAARSAEGAVASAMAPFDNEIAVAPYETACFTLCDAPDILDHTECCNGTFVVTTTLNPRGMWDSYYILPVAHYYGFRRGRPTPTLVLPGDIWLGAPDRFLHREWPDEWDKMFRTTYRLYRKAGHAAILVMYQW